MREWLARLWELKFKQTVGILEFSEMPILASNASVSFWMKRIRSIQPNLPEEEVLTFINDIVDMRTKYSAKEVEQHINGFFNQSNAVLILIVEQEISIFTKTLGTQFPDEFLSKCRRFLRITEQTPLAWGPTLDSPLIETLAASVLYGQIPNEFPQQLAIGNKLKLFRERLYSSVPPQRV
jgi:hypothetical protein